MLAMRRFSFLPLVTLAACGGSVALPGTSSSGGGAGGTPTSSATTTAPASTTSSSASTGTGGACAHCAQALTEPLTAKVVCPGASTTLFEAAKSCICDGACKAFCDGTSQLCGGPESPASCIGCENDAQNGCGAAQQACVADKG
jgi:hypothetical protein